MPLPAVPDAELLPPLPAAELDPNMGLPPLADLHHFDVRRFVLPARPTSLSPIDEGSGDMSDLFRTIQSMKWFYVEFSDTLVIGTHRNCSSRVVASRIPEVMIQVVSSSKMGNYNPTKTSEKSLKWPPLYRE